MRLRTKTDVATGTVRRTTEMPGEGRRNKDDKSYNEERWRIGTYRNLRDYGATRVETTSQWTQHLKELKLRKWAKKTVQPLKEIKSLLCTNPQFPFSSYANLLTVMYRA